MEIRKIAGIAPDDRAAVDEAFAGIEPLPVACCNWPAEFPYAPEVSFRMFHTGDWLMLRFDVAERYTAALVTEDNGEVWTDSCAEFFIAPDTGMYYNFETTCIGRMLLGARKSRTEAEHASPEVLAGVNTPRMPRPGSWKASCATRASGRAPSPNTRATTAGRSRWPSPRRRFSAMR